MKALFVGDMHCKQDRILPKVSEAINLYDIDKVYFLGDYTDDWGLTGRYMIDALEFQVDWYKNQKIEISNIVGNHDICYFFDYAGPGTNMPMRKPIKELLQQLDMTIVDTYNDYVITHGGIVEEYFGAGLSTQDILSKLKRLYESGSFIDFFELYKAGKARGGTDIPSPLWADQTELYDSHVPGMKQIVGHSPVDTIIAKQYDDGAILLLCDTFTDGNDSMLFMDGDAPYMIRKHNLDAVPIKISKE